MNFDFKITTWERIQVEDDMEELVLSALKEGKIESSNDIYDYLADEGDANISSERLMEVEEQMTVKENFGNATIEVYENTKLVWDNNELTEND